QALSLNPHNHAFVIADVPSDDEPGASPDLRATAGTVSLLPRHSHGACTSLNAGTRTNKGASSRVWRNSLPRTPDAAQHTARIVVVIAILVGPT
ncbi:hypothetical protein EV177_009679, partial [Coemansia sp. RSA 1804]